MAMGWWSSSSNVPFVTGPLTSCSNLRTARLAALVPRPKAHLVRYHALFAPNARHRHLIVPRRTRRPSRPPGDDARTNTPMSWMARLKRVFNLDISVCPKCGGKVRVIAAVTEPNAIAQILEHPSPMPSPRSSSTCIGATTKPANHEGHRRASSADSCARTEDPR